MARQNPFLAIAKKCRIKPYDIEELVLKQAGLESIEPRDLELFPNLQLLYIPNNKLKRIDNLTCNIRITVIDARCNEISSLNIPTQEALRELYLSDNRIVVFEDFLEQIKHLKNLEVLDIRGNAAAQEPNCKQRLLEELPCLKVLNGVEIERKDKIVALRDRRPHPKGRSQSMLEFLQTRKPEVGLMVTRRVTQMKRRRDLAHRKEMEKMEAAAAEQRERYRQAAMAKTIPMPEGMDFLGMSQKVHSETQRTPRIGQRPKTRLFIKTPVLKTSTVTQPEEELYLQLNDGLGVQAIMGRFNSKVVYPTAHEY